MLTTAFPRTPPLSVTFLSNPGKSKKESQFEPRGCKEGGNWSGLLYAYKAVRITI